MKVRYLARAIKDLGKIDTYLRRESPAGATRIGARIRKRADDLALFPKQGTLSDETGLYQL